MKRIFPAVLFLLFLATPSYALPRIQGIACSTGGCLGIGTCTATCTLTGVTAGSKIIGGANTNQNQTITVADDCGGTYIPYDPSTAGTSYALQFVGTGSSGTCHITMSAPNTFRVSGVVEEMTTGYNIDVHSAQDPGTTQTSITTASVTAGGADYCLTVAVDKNGQATIPTIGGVFTARDNDGIFPIIDADGIVSAGAVTATWSGWNAAATPAAFMMCFTPPGSSLAGPTGMIF